MPFCRALPVVALTVAVQATAFSSAAATESREYRHCLATSEAAQGATYAMVGCTYDEIDRQDARLNEAYRLVMRRLTPARRIILRIEERRWIAARDRRCEQAAAREDGDLVRLARSGCLLDETIQRRQYLETYRAR